MSKDNRRRSVIFGTAVSSILLLGLIAIIVSSISSGMEIKEEAVCVDYCVKESLRLERDYKFELQGCEIAGVSMERILTGCERDFKSLAEQYNDCTMELQECNSR